MHAGLHSSYMRISGDEPKEARGIRGACNLRATPHRWMEDGPLRLEQWVSSAEGSAGTLAEGHPPRDTLNSTLSMFGFTREAVDVLVSAMVAGKEGLGSMGVDTPLAVLSAQPKQPSHYFKQLFAQVSNL